MPSYASRIRAEDFEANYQTLSGNGRQWTGTAPPKLKSDDPNEKWVITDTRRLARSNPNAGYSFENVPVWSKINFNQVADKKEDVKPSAPAPAPAPQQPAASSQQVADRRAAYERAQEYQTQNAAIPRTPPPANPMSKDFYSDLNAYGRAYINDYLTGRKTEQKRVELAIAEGLDYGTRLSQQIDPKKMAVSKPTTFDETMAQLERYKELIA